MGKGKITGTAVLTGLLLAGAAGCGGAQPPGGASETAHRLPKVLSASQLEQQKAVKITECAANASEDLVLAGTVMNVLPRTAGFQLRFDIYDANGVLLEGPGALFTSPGIASIQPGETGQFTDISPLNGSSTVTPVTCVLRGAVVRPPRSARTRSPAMPVPASLPAMPVPANPAITSPAIATHGTAAAGTTGFVPGGSGIRTPVTSIPGTAGSDGGW